IKKDEVRRKTDGFMAFVHALYRADEIIESNLDDELEFLNSLDF
ncbi:terminase, partial [Staphylococcus argenteus]